MMTRVLTSIAAIALGAAVVAEERLPSEWENALDLRKAVVIDGKKVMTSPRELTARGVHPGAFAPPKLIKGTRPTYPEVAARERYQGIVILECAIGASGAVDGCRVKTSVQLDLDRAAILAIQQWKYEPSRLDGEARSIVASFMVTFRLN